MAADPGAVRADDGARIRAALWFAEHGFGVFSCWSARPDGTCRCPAGRQCSSPGKHPITQNGFQDATMDAARIRTMLAAASHPNYGLVCPDGVFAWDVDGEGWQDQIAALEARHGPLPPTLRTDTANGQHVFLRWPDGHPRPLHRMFGWVTRWGSGRQAGYVIGPRSIHPSGHEYAPSGVFEIAILPEAWAIATAEPTTIRVGGREAPEDVGVGRRHDWLRDTARHYAGVVRDPDALFAAVWAENEKLAAPKTRDEVLRAIGDVLSRFPADPVEVDEETGETRRVSDDDPGMLSLRDDESLFPPPPEAIAYGGLLGECVDVLMDGTDASPVALLASLLAFCGALMPAHGYWHGNHTSSPFLALVGRSSVGRKGTAMYRVRDALGNALQMDAVNRIRFDGLASGEALVKALLDRARDTFGVPNGVLFEEEYATFLAAAGRDQSNLDSRMRQVFDGKPLAHRRVAETITVPEPYWLSGLIAITPEELRSKVTLGSFKSGSGNRWLWLPVTRRPVRVVSEPPILPLDIGPGLLRAHRERIKDPLHVERGAGVDDLLSEYDEFLRAGSVGLAADMTRRYSVIAFRCAMVHASVEGSRLVTLEHARRCVALTEYARSGLEWTFGEALGDQAATHLLRMLRDEGGLLTQGTISKHFIRDPIRRQAAIDELSRLGLAEVHRVRGRGRTRTELRLVVRATDFRDFRALNGTPPESRFSPASVESGGNGVFSDGMGARPIGKVRESSSSEWLVSCRDYPSHPDSHHQTPRGWLCDACEAGSPSGFCTVCGEGPFLSAEFLARHGESHA